MHICNFLTISTLGKIFSKQHFEIFILFSQKTGFDISCKLFPMETICMKCQILIAWKSKKNHQFVKWEWLCIYIEKKKLTEEQAQNDEKSLKITWRLCSVSVEMRILKNKNHKTLSILLLLLFFCCCFFVCLFVWLRICHTADITYYRDNPTWLLGDI